MINYKNTAENIAIFFIGGILGALIGVTTVMHTTDNIIKQMTPTIMHAIDKETIKNEIKNEIKVDIDKIKKSDSLKIVIDQKPINNQKPTNVVIKEKDSAIDKDTRSWFGRTFGKKKKE